MDNAEPTIAGYQEHPDNPDWISLTFSDGSQAPFAYDPTKEFRAQATQVASALGTNAPPAQDPNTFSPPGGPEPVGMPPVSAAPSPAVAPMPSVAAVPDVAAPATPSPVIPQAPIVVPGSKGGTKVTDTGIVLKPATKAAMRNADDLRQQALDAEKVANEGALTSKENVLDQRFENQSNERLQLQSKYNAGEQLLAKKQEARTQELQRIKERNARPIDPGEAFRGDDGGAFAFMASIGMAIANFGTTLTGHGAMVDPLAPIRDIIDRSVKIQTEQKRADFDAGMITADELRGDIEDIKSKQMALGSQIVNAQRGLDNTKEELVGIDGMAAAFKAEEAKSAAAAADAKSAQAIALAPHRTIEHLPGTPAHKASPAELAAYYKDYSEIYKNNPEAADRFAKGIGLNVSNGEPVQGHPPASPEERKDLRTEVSKVIGTALAFKELDSAIGAHRDHNGKIVAHNGVISGNHPIRQFVEANGAKVGGALGTAAGIGTSLAMAPVSGGTSLLGTGAAAAAGGAAGAAAGIGASSLMSATDSDSRKAVDRAKVKIINALAHAKGEEGGSGAALNDREIEGYNSMLNPNDATAFYAGASDLYNQKVMAPYKTLVTQFGQKAVDQYFRENDLPVPSMHAAE